MLVVAKSVTWTLDPNRPRKTGSRYNDMLNCLGKPRELLQCHKNSRLIPLLTVRRSAETALGGNFTLFLPGIRVKWLST